MGMPKYGNEQGRPKILLLPLPRIVFPNKFPKLQRAVQQSLNYHKSKHFTGLSKRFGYRLGGSGDELVAAGEGDSGIGVGPGSKGLGEVGTSDLGGVTPLGTGKTGSGTTEVSGITSCSGGFDVGLASPAGSR